MIIVDFMYLAIFIITAFASLLIALPYIHIFQLESYKIPQLFMRLREAGRHLRRKLPSWLLAILAQLVLLSALLSTQIDGSLANGWSFPYVAFLVMAVLFLLEALWVFLSWKQMPSKKPLKYTHRVVRLCIVFVVVIIALQFVWYVLLVIISYPVEALLTGKLSFMEYDFRLARIGLSALLFQWLLFLFLPRLLAMAAIAVQPVETAIKNWYFNDARKKLAGFTDMIKIGITGSYGKTSAKMILATILREKYKTLATPSSYNTPMGVTKVIREQLDGSYQVFIAEMGARHVGDIAEMCRLVSPKYGLITSIGPQHLETFFTMENIIKTKYELVEALPKDGMAFFPGDNDICLELYRNTAGNKALFGIEQRGEPLCMSAGDVTHGPRGSTFTLTGPDGNTVSCTTKLLGGHNVQNTLGCAAVAWALGLTLHEISQGIGKVEPVEHRMQLIPTTNGVAVIDDAFNSNPAGTRAALEVLRSFPGRKIIITPGLVELGGSEFAENKAFGQAMAAAVDIAILVARNGIAMKQGLEEAGFDQENIIVTGRLAEATTALSRLIKVGDVVLFENDLPDHYEN